MLGAIKITRMGAHEMISSTEDSVILFKLIILLTVLLYESINKIELLL